MIDRRDFLRLASAGGAGLLVARRAGVLSTPAAIAAEGVFGHGVASGDPTPSSVVLWTRITPSPEALPGSGLGPAAQVPYEVAAEPNFRKVIRKGTVSTSAARDHTVKIDVEGLAPDIDLYFRFRYGSEISSIGRTRTMASPGEKQRSFRFGLASCANWEGGHFAAYGHLADRRDLDVVIHMGDYLYEYGPGGYGQGASFGRVHEPDHEIVSLADYRIRHAQYKTDPHLQACHAAHPFITAWDDHEVANDTWREGAENHNEGEGDFTERRNRAYRAYFEWMPIRLPQANSDPRRIYRRLQLGSLADIHMLDTRQYRDEQVGDQLDPARTDAERTITGTEQMGWLKKGLSSKGPHWRLIGNQLMISPWDVVKGIPLNVDAWDGYPADRTELLTHIQSASVENVVFLTGDIHTSWANEVPIDANTYPVTSSVAVEIVGPSITSDNLDEIAGSPPRTTSLALEEGIKAENPHVKFVELDSHGYVVVDLTKERLHADWFYVEDRTDAASGHSFGAAYEVGSGTSTVTEAAGPMDQQRHS